MRLGRHKGTTEYCRWVDGIEGKIVRLLPGADYSHFENIPQKFMGEELGTFSGRWTKELYLDEEVVFDCWKDFPYVVKPLPISLQSDSYKREDLRLRVQLDFERAQEEKERIEGEQRRDRQLRAQHPNK